MATLNVTSTTDFRGRSIFNIDQITVSGSGVTARFDANQFGPGEISNSVSVVSQSGIRQQIFVSMSSPGVFSAQGWDVIGWSTSALPFRFDGSTGNDSITGTEKADIITGGRGADALSGGGGADRFVYASPDELATGETIAGGSGTDTIVVSGNTGIFAAVNAGISSVEAFRFDGDRAFTARFSDAQLSGTAIRAVTGNSAANRLEVRGSDIDLSGVAFGSWTAGQDTITLTGTSGIDTVTGSSQNDILIGGGEADILDGGGGDDIFRILQGDDTALAGEVIRGGTGTDTIEVLSASSLSRHTISSVETLKFSATGVVSLDPAQIGAGRITTVSGSAGFNQVAVSPQDRNASTTIDLSGVVFASWTAGEDVISMSGSNLADIIRGSAQNDLIQAGNGADQVAALGGNDVISIFDDEFAAGEVIDGGDGIDRLRVVDGSTADFSGSTVRGVEELEFVTDAVHNLSFNDSQIRTGAIATVISTGKANFITVIGTAVNLGGVSFVNWDNDGERVTIRGTSASDTLIGSSQNDLFIGSAGADVLIGGGGVNTLSYAGSAGPVAVDLPSGTVSGGDASGDVISNFSNLIGTSGADIMAGDSGANRLEGGRGADVLNGGGGGNDTLSYAGSTAAVLINLGNGDASGGDAAGDSFANFENLIGSAFADALFGDGLANTIDGGIGADTLFGGLNDDSFVFEEGRAGGDTIVDFAGNGAAAGDQIRFVGYGAGSLAQVDATHWRVTNEDASFSEVFIIANGAAIDPSDILFV